MIKLLYKIPKYIFLYFLLPLVIILLIPYIFCPFYDFREPAPFSGKEIYNPYQDIHQKDWKRCNFHVHANSWGFITSGGKSNNTSERIYETYQSLEYSNPCISDYQRINEYNNTSENYIPVYEHGYCLTKNHQLCIGAGKTSWSEFVFFQTRHQEQEIINRLRPTCEILALAHPSWQKAYSNQDLKYLSGYDCFEAINGNKMSVQHWDTVLSSGYIGWVLANDDGHDIEHLSQVGKCFTMINAPSGSRADIINSIRAGKTIGVKVFTPKNPSLLKKQQQLAALKPPKEITFSNDTLYVFSENPIKEIRFIGQNGVVKKTADKDFGFYVLKPDDTYIRTEIELKTKTILYLNPVYRCHSGMGESTINTSKTTIFRLLLLLGIAILFLSGTYLTRKTTRLPD